MRISFVVLSFRRFVQTTGPCLDSLFTQCQPGRDQLILVDNGSEDDAQGLCAKWAHMHPTATFEPLALNLGFGGGMNHGVKKSQADWVFLVNSDTLFPRGAVEAIHRTINRLSDSVAMIGPVTQEAGNGQCLPLPGMDMAQVLEFGARVMEEPTGLLTPQYRTDFFCVGVRRRVWEELGGLDPVFGLGYYEDFDFSLRLRDAGYEQIIAEDVFIAHTGSASFATMRPEQKALLKRNKDIFLQRHPDAQLPHMRDSNAHALRYLLSQHPNLETIGLRNRAQHRRESLLSHKPRSLLKRWWWWWQTRDLF